jgi:hypothetical protein
MIVVQEQVRRRGERLWLLQDQNTGNWTLFRDEASARTAQHALETGRATFCGGCGRWLNYGETRRYHSPCREGEQWTVEKRYSDLQHRLRQRALRS